MAKRVIDIDGTNVRVNDGDMISDTLRESGKSSAKSVIVDGEVLTPDRWNRPTPMHGMLTNAADIEKGGQRERLLDQECDMIAHHFLKQFPGSPKRRITIGDDYEYITIQNFPLSDEYSPDYINLLILTYGYPHVPPAGVHVQSNSPNLRKIRWMLGGHVFNDEQLPDSYKQYVEELSLNGWTWICYHYANWSWRLNPNNLLSGDCIYKYVENVHSALSGRA